MLILEIILLLIVAEIIFLYSNPVFGGRISKNDRIDYEKRAQNYVKGKFVYPNEYKILGEAEDKRVSNKGTSPKAQLPLVKPSITDKLSIDEVTVTWFGHSTVLLRMHSMNILFDPVFSKRSSPFSFVGPKRFTEAPIDIKDMPDIDIMIVTHNHYDHLDINSIRKFDSRVKRYIVPLGIEKTLMRFGIDKNKIQNMAWWEEIKINGLTIACTPSRHFANRQIFDYGKTLYASWVLKDEKHQIFESGDGGVGGHFEEIHKRYGDFDLAIMENGQYNIRWHDIHMFPEEARKASNMLGAKLSMPIHWGTFVLSNHGWDDSVERFVKDLDKNNNEVITPRIGETVNLNRYTEYQEKWWRKIE
ncbi:L-ascorbate metabolism protein UlaG, beta-lactamase superfamily [Clostridium sp. DSM 8431]|nr:L-ascorbate metabolism protein UlaG, beta-lactamase superfamily [Clostridium sp. DSM 8431]